MGGVLLSSMNFIISTWVYTPTFTLFPWSLINRTSTPSFKVLTVTPYKILLTMEKHVLRRSTSEPPPSLISHCSTSPISVSSLSRRRFRRTILSYEQGKDCVGMWLNMWDSEQVCNGGYSSIYLIYIL